MEHLKKANWTNVFSLQEGTKISADFVRLTGNKTSFGRHINLSMLGQKLIECASKTLIHDMDFVIQGVDYTIQGMNYIIQGVDLNFPRHIDKFMSGIY